MKDFEKIVKELNEEKIKYHHIHGKIYKQKGTKGHMEEHKDKEEKK